MIYTWLEKQSTAQLNNEIDKKTYNEQHLVEIKIPLNMPYIIDKEFEVAYGEKEINGIQYQYVKRKISNNILYLLCLPNNIKSSLVTEKNNLEKDNSQADNNKSDKKNSTLSLSKSLQQEYLPTNNDNRVANKISFKVNIPKINNIKAGDLFTPLTPSQPPEFCI